MTKYYPLSDTEPGDERIGIGDPTTRTEAIWQKDWDIKPFLYKVYETLPPIALTRDLPDTGRPALEAIAATGARSSGVACRSRPGATRSPRPADQRLARPHLDHPRRPRTPLPHGRRHRRAVPPRAVLRLHRSRRAGRRRLPLLRDRPQPALAALGGPPRHAGGGDRERTVGRHRTRRAGHDEHLLAQRVALPRARLPAHLLGRRHVARAHPRGRGIGARRDQAGVRLRRSAGQQRCSASTGYASPRWRSSRSATPRLDHRTRRRPSGSIFRPGGCRRRR